MQLKSQIMLYNRQIVPYNCFMEKIMDYYKVGQRIRKFRKANNLSQEQLAEKAGISTTHMSHIETGHTKLSLAVFFEIAEALSVQTDQLLYDVPENNKTVMKGKIAEILDSCSPQEMYILADMAKALKVSLDKHRTPDGT